MYTKGISLVAFFSSIDFYGINQYFPLLIREGTVYGSYQFFACKAAGLGECYLHIVVIRESFKKYLLMKNQACK